MSTRLRGILFAVLGLVLVGLGIIAVVVIYFLRMGIGGQGQAIVPVQGPTGTAVVVVKSKVVVAVRDKKLGDLLAADDLDIVEVPSEFVPRDAVALVESAVGKFVKADLIQGEMILEHNLADPTNNNHDLSFILSDEHVLMAFPATDLMSTSGVILRGDIVDILATLSQEVKQQQQNIQPNQPTQEPVFQLFTFDAFQRVGVTALVVNILTNQAAPTQGPADQTPVPTPTLSRNQIEIVAYLLALTPQDALVLKHLKDVGAVFDIVLRSPTSTNQFNLTPVSEQYIVELYGLEILP